MDLTRLSPPVNTSALNDDGLHAPLWQAHHQELVDALQALAANRGVTDGSDARPGERGEYMTATAGPVALVTNTQVNVVSLDLPAGDWDVSGQMRFDSTSGGPMNAVGCGFGTIDAFLDLPFGPGATTQSLPTAVHRYNVTATTTVWLVALSFFSGTVTATASIRARRVR